MKKSIIKICILLGMFALQKIDISATEEQNENETYKVYQNEFVEVDGKLYFYDDNGNMVHWQQTIEGKEYYFTGNGYAYKGMLYYEDGSIKYYKDDYSMAKNEFVNHNNELYYMGLDGSAQYGDKIINGKSYYFTADGSAYKGILQKNDGTVRVYKENGSMAVNEFVTIEDKLYYMGSDGAPLMWQQTIEGKEYYFTGNGYAYKGMLYYEDGSLRYYLSDGSMAKNTFVEANGKLYYMGSDGAPLMWQQTIEGKEYYFTGNGYAYKGMLYYEDGSLRYYLSDGSMAKNTFVETNGKLYYMGSDGAPLMWRQTIEGKQYYFTGNGYAYKGMLYYEDGSLRYYLTDGSMAKESFVETNGKLYYMGSDGAPLMWQQTIEGKEYYFTGNGYAYKGMLYYEDGKVRYYKADGIMAKKEWSIINGKSMYFDENGEFLKNKSMTIEGIEYVFDSNGFINSWTKGKDGEYYYYSHGEKLYGWQRIGNQKYFFNEDGHRIGNGPVKKVIDISEHNGNIDWDKVSKEDIDFVILRLGYGSDGKDKKFERNLKEIQRLGIPFGIYLYSYAENAEEAKWESAFVISELNKYGIDQNTHIFYDIEKPKYLDNRDVIISTQQYKKIIPAFINEIKNAGYCNASVYTYRYYLETALNDSLLIKYVDWIAEYNDHVYYKENISEMLFSGWQYTSSGRISGIMGNVDISVFF